MRIRVKRFASIIIIVLFMLSLLNLLSIAKNNARELKLNIRPYLSPANVSLYNGSAVQPLLCFVNVGSADGVVNVSVSGSANSFLYGYYSFKSSIELNAGDKTYNVTVPEGEYGTTAYVAAIADNLTYPGSGGRISLVVDTGHNDSVSSLRMKVITYFDGGADGIVWYKVDLEWSNDGATWYNSLVFYNVSVNEETMETPFQVFFAKGRYVRLNVTMVWTPDSENSNVAHAYLVTIIDAIVSSCWEATPNALVNYRIFMTHTNATITLPSTVTASVDYFYKTYNISFPIETKMALYAVNITPPLETGGYNLTMIIDENGNPLPFKVWENGNVSVLMPMISQNITVVYTKEGKATGARWLPPDGLIWFFDFGDAIEQYGTTQGWIGYGRYYDTDVQLDPVRNDYSLHTRLTTNVYVSTGGWYIRNLVLPPGDYYAAINLYLQYTYWSYYGRVQLIFFFREYDGTYRSYYLVNGRYYSFDATVKGEITAQKWGNQVYFSVRSYYSYSGSETWIRWAYLVGVPYVNYTINEAGNGHKISNATVLVNGSYYIILPWFNSSILELFDSGGNTGFITVKSESNISFTMKQESSIKINLTGGSNVDLYYFPRTIIVPPGTNFSITIQASVPSLSSFIYPDPPLSNQTILFVLSRNGTIVSQNQSKTNQYGVATTVLQSLANPGPSSLTVVPLAWPFVIPTVVPVYVESVAVYFYGPEPLFMKKNETILEGLHAEYKYSGLPFYGKIYLELNKTGITIEPTDPDVITGYGEFYIYSDNISGRYLVSAVNATSASGSLIFPVEGNKTVIVVGAKIIIEVIPEGPPWHVYSNITWIVTALYDDGSPANGTGYIVIEKDHYTIDNITWNGDTLNYTLVSAGYVNYVRAVFYEPLGLNESNYSLVVAIPNIGNTTPVNNTGSVGNVGVELMSFEIETYQMAALKDGVLTMIFIGLSLLPYILRRYYAIFRGPIGLLIWTAILFGITLMTMIGRAQIPIDAYIVQTPNGTTIEPVYVDNPFVQIYVAPLIIEFMVIFHSITQIIVQAMNKIIGGR